MTRLRAILFDFDGTLLNSRLSPAQLHDGAAELLQMLQHQGYSLGLVTSAREPLRLLARLGIAEYFAVAIGAESLTESKPNPQGIELALEQLDTPNEAAVYIGDTTTDIYASKAAELRAAIGITHGYANRRELETAGPDYIIDSLAEVCDLISKI